MAYNAITIDTSVFSQYSYQIESGLFKQLDQFYVMPAILVFSEIVVREVWTHMEKQASETVKQLEAALDKCGKNLNSSSGSINQVRSLLVPSIDCRDMIGKRLHHFIESKNGEVVSVKEQISIDEIVERYFYSEAPFSGSGSKKNEFPDAMALLSLEKWAMRNGYQVLAVSRDGDWKRFSQVSDYIDVIEDLASALEYFQPDNTAHEFCYSLKNILYRSPKHPLHEEIICRIETELSECMPVPEADSIFLYDWDSVEIETQEVKLRDDESLIPVQAQKDSLVVQGVFSVAAIARCYFDFSVRDSIDKDYVPMGSCVASAELEPDVDVLIHLYGDFSSVELVTVEHVELLTEIRSVNFGEVEPSWMKEPPAPQ
ncbi:PIN domain-containing protein [Halorhodospira neutriphila]|uniref:PIN domain-containing protein n=1 Tax=Halorhodospira neutriphila TaxID=168379 RepID=UPI001908FBED|nr:PIN domain-containing protein [Halorhodospira neutriphila]